MQSLCDIDLTKTVHDKKIQLILEEQMKKHEELLRKQKEEIKFELGFGFGNTN